MNEREFQAAVVKAARLAGWTAFHWWSSRHSPAGYPDLVLLRPPEMIHAELKVGKNRPTAVQQETHDLLRQCGQEVVVWYPCDLDAIIERLQRG